MLHEYSHAFLFPLLPLLEIWASFRCKLLFVFEGDFLLYLLLGTHAFNFGQSSFVLRIISASPIQLLLLQIAIQGVVATHLLPPPKNHHVRSEAGLLQLFFHLLQLSMCPRQIDHSYPIKCFLVQLLIQNRVSLFQVREPREHRVEQAKSFASPSGWLGETITPAIQTTQNMVHIVELKVVGRVEHKLDSANVIFLGMNELRPQNIIIVIWQVHSPSGPLIA